MEPWRLLPFRMCNAAENMAVDEALFRGGIRRKASPTLRFYGWRTPALSIGYFQDFEKEVDSEACKRFGIDFIRRPTGGKAVLHDRELTYCVVAGEDSSLFPPDILKTYRVISLCIAAGLADLGIETMMKGEGRAAPEERLRASCFSLPSRYELLASGRKICGSAQVRSHGAFLQHGSLLTAFDPVLTCAVMLPHGDVEKQARRLLESVTTIQEEARGRGAVSDQRLCEAILGGFERVLGIRFEEGCLTPEEEDLTAELLTKKYLSQTWNREGRKVEWISGL